MRDDRGMEHALDLLDPADALENPAGFDSCRSAGKRSSVVSPVRPGQGNGWRIFTGSGWNILERARGLIF
jgi:hypothetical protein